jgi:ATP-dependent protease ClpP protease subunit
VKLNIKGTIIPNSQAWFYEFLEIEHTSPKMVERFLEEANGQEIEVHINSPGGSVYAGSEIYTSLKEYKGKTTGKVVGIAASAASLVAMALNVVFISPTAQMMIHNAWNTAEGDKNYMRWNANMLESTDEGLMNAYLMKTKMKKEDLMKLLDETTFMNAEKAVELGFADEIMFKEELEAVAYNGYMIPEELINKIKNKLLEQKVSENQEETKNQEELAQAKARLRLLSL